MDDIEYPRMMSSSIRERNFFKVRGREGSKGGFQEARKASHEKHVPGSPPPGRCLASERLVQDEPGESRS